MTDRERWLKIARAFHKPNSKRTAEERSMTIAGLCRAFINMKGVGISIVRRPCNALWSTNQSVYFWPTWSHKGHKRKYDLLRAELARKWAKESKP